jgi:hypothetical protein
MHLREACIDINGQVAVEGQFLYPPDDAGHFLPKHHDRVRIQRYGKSLELAAANSQRDNTTNFLITEEVGRVVFCRKLSVRSLCMH